MERRKNLRTAAALSVLALLLLIAATVMIFLSDGIAAQEHFEHYLDPVKYTAALRDAGQPLHVTLAVDDLFIVAYLGALGFAALGFRDEKPAAALVAGLGAFALAALDFWENSTIGTSLDMALAGVSIDGARIAYQAAISAAKWNAAAVTLVALSFAIPKERFFETLLAWAARLIFPAATALFVTDAAGLRQLGLFAIYGGMLSGFALIAIATYNRSRDGLR
jgi:hypothetical protein